MGKNDRSYIGERIRDLRKTRGLTQADLAKKLQVDPAMISYYEKGRYTPSVEVLIKLATLLDVSIDYILIKEVPFTPLNAGTESEMQGLLHEASKLREKDREVLRYLIRVFMERGGE